MPIRACRGTTVRIYLPRAAERLALAMPGKSATGRQPRGSEKILLVEDDALVREMV